MTVAPPARHTVKFNDPTAFLAVGFFLILLLLTGCTAFDQPYKTDQALDRSLSQRARVRIIAGSQPQAPADREVLLKLVVEDRHPLAVREAAIDRLIEVDAPKFWQAMNVALPMINRPELFEFLAERVGTDEHAASLDGWLIRWSLPTPGLVDSHDPMRKALVELLDIDPQEQSLPHVLMDRYVASRSDHLAVAAWVALAERTHPQWLNTLLKTSIKDVEERTPNQHDSGKQTLANFLLAVSPEHRLPTNRETLSWAEKLKAEGYQITRDLRYMKMRRTMLMAGLEGDVRPHLRHLPLMMHSENWDLSRGQIEDFAEAENHVVRERRRFSEGLFPSAQPDKMLVCFDYTLERAIRSALQDSNLMSQWFDQADADHADTTSEHGGVLTWDEQGALIAKSFPPAERLTDKQFVNPPAAIEAMYAGLAHYHFHAQRHDNAKYARHGPGDLRFTREMQAATLVLTFIDRDTLNVDLAIADQVVIDLGDIKRPGSN
jgi:hypothetical protein